MRTTVRRIRLAWIALLAAVLLTVAVPVVAFADAPPSSPVTVLTSEWPYGVGDTFQRHVFIASGRHWILYAGGAPDYHVVLKSSADLVTWTTADLGVSFDYSNDMAACYDGAYFHDAYEFGGTIYYRRATLNSGGTITWSTGSWATVVTGVRSGNINNPSSLITDTSGHVFIAYQDDDGGNWHPFVTMNANTDGTWSTAVGFPANVSPAGVSFSGSYPELTQLAADKVYAVTRISSSGSYGDLWTGSSWTGKETIPLTSPSDVVSITSTGAAVDLVYLSFNGANAMIRNATRSYSGTWTDSATIPTIFTWAAVNSPYPTSTRWGSSDLRVFYAYGNDVYSFSRSGGVWDSAPTVIADETAVYEPNWEVSAPVASSVYDYSYDRQGLNMAGVTYITGTNPYSLRYLVVSDPVPAEPGGSLLKTSLNITMASSILIGAVAALKSGDLKGGLLRGVLTGVLVYGLVSSIVNAVL